MHAVVSASMCLSSRLEVILTVVCVYFDPRCVRDTFYEVVREWEEQCGKPGWSMEEKLGDKIR